MKTITMITLTVSASVILFGSCSSTGQQVKAQQGDVEYQEVPVPEQFISDEYPRPDVWTKYPGGADQLQRYIQLNTRIPEPARRAGYAGRLTITYVVDENGNAGDVEALMSPHESITEMYRSIILNMEQWEPALLNGEPVEQRYVIISTFREGN